MSRLTNYAENKLADLVRGQGIPLPTNWFFALGSAADDTGFTEITGTNYSRVSVARNLTNFSGTQAALSTGVSTGTSHETRNNITIEWPLAGTGGWPSASQVGLYDASTGGNCWFYGPLGTAVAVSAGSSFSLIPSAAVFQLGVTGGMTDLLANLMIDLLWRGQSFTWPASLYVRLVTSTPTNASGGVEVAVGGYTRVALAASLAALSGTQGAGTTVASTGTLGRISNNAALTYPTPSAAWGTLVGAEIMTALTGGDRYFWGTIPSKTVNAGALPPRFDPNTIGITFA